jgi:tRNA(adenine34) deaminase
MNGFSLPPLPGALSEASLRHWMTIALTLARKALLVDEVPVGAVAVHEGMIVGAAHNMNRALCDPTAHAEIVALRQASKALQCVHLTKVMLVVTLEPCPMCAAAIVEARIPLVYFGAYDPKGGGVDHGPRLWHPPSDRPVPEYYGGVFGHQASARLLKDFFSEKRSKDAKL